MSDGLLVSIVIPVWRDADALALTLQGLHVPADGEVIAACALGEESRYREASKAHPGVRWVSAPRGRASQMNAGAAHARGRWLLFLHADSVLPADWAEVVAEAETRPHVAAGAFRFALDSPHWQARVVEFGVRLRVALLGLPYGDQALFVRRRHFDAIGGYRDLPLMEDVDFVRRVKRTGRLLHARSAVVTSARRWQSDGWFRRSARNLTLAARYLLGASPAQLAQRYFGRKAAALVVMGRAPWTGGKTRLAVGTDEAGHAALRQALFLDTLDVVRSITAVEHIVACEPSTACEQMRDVVGPAVDVIAQRGEDLGGRLTHVFEDVFRTGAESIVVVGSDLPDLPARVLEEALTLVSARDDRVVIGPAADGGYYLIGMNRHHPELFRGIEWSSDRVLDQTRGAAKAHGLRVVSLQEWSDVDAPSDLARFDAHGTTAVAVRTHAWRAAHLGPR